MTTSKQADITTWRQLSRERQPHESSNARQIVNLRMQIRKIAKTNKPLAQRINRAVMALAEKWGVA